jgi:transposase InsO family protein
MKQTTRNTYRDLNRLGKLPTLNSGKSPRSAFVISKRSKTVVHGLIASMSRQGACCDNAAMEAVWSSLKNELVHLRRFAIRTDACTAFSIASSPYTTAPVVTPRSAT